MGEREQTPEEVRASIDWSDGDYAPGPSEDWYCRCREVAPDRIGTVPVLRPSRQPRCSVCFTDAPWSALR